MYTAKQSVFSERARFPPKVQGLNYERLASLVGKRTSGRSESLIWAIRGGHGSGRVKAGIGRAIAAFLQLKNIGNLKELTLRATTCLTLWIRDLRQLMSSKNRLDTLNTISSDELWQRTNQLSADVNVDHKKTLEIGKYRSHGKGNNI